MPRFSASRLAHDGRERLREELFRIVAALRSLDEVRRFLRDLCTPSELVMFMRRIHVASLLLDGTSYDDIRKCLRVSKSLVQAVSRKLSMENGGFEIACKVFIEIEEEIRDEVSVALKREDPHSLESHMRRFAGYYMGAHLSRHAPKMLRNAAAAHSRRRDLKRRKKT